MDTHTLLLSIFLILLIYCFMHYCIYYNKTNYINDNEIESKIIILDIINNNNINKNNIINTNNKNNIKNNKNNKNINREKFTITESELNTYNTNLEQIDKYLDNIIKKKSISENLLELYKQQYIEYINKGNAISFNEYQKYMTPEQNIFYSQYL